MWFTWHYFTTVSVWSQISGSFKAQSVCDLLGWMRGNAPSKKPSALLEWLEENVCSKVHLVPISKNCAIIYNFVSYSHRCFFAIRQCFVKLSYSTSVLRVVPVVIIFSHLSLSLSVPLSTLTHTNTHRVDYLMQSSFCFRVYYNHFLGGFPDSSVGKGSACNAGDPSLFPGSGRSTGEGIGYPLQYSWASLVVQLIKNSPTMWETWVRFLAWEDPLEKGKALLTPVFWPREFHRLYSPLGHKESDTTQQLS